MHAPKEVSSALPRPLLAVEAEHAAVLHAVPPVRDEFASADVGDLVLETGWVIRGTVRGEDGEAIPDARLALEPLRPPDDLEHLAGSWVQAGWCIETLADAQGQFQLAGVPPRSFALTAQAEGYVSGWFRGAVETDGAQIDLRLRRGKSVRVRVEDKTGEPVVGARVGLYRGFRAIFAGNFSASLQLERRAATDVTGCCTLTGLADWKYHIRAESGNLAGADEHVLAGVSEVTIRVSPFWNSCKYVYEGDLHPTPVTCFPSDGLRSGIRWLRTGPGDSTNRFRPPPPPPPASAASSKRRAPPPDRATLHVTVRSADGIPMPQARVSIGVPERAHADTGDDGSVLIYLDQGRYEYCVKPRGFGTRAAEIHGAVEAPGGIETNLDVRLPLVYSVPVEVRSADGMILPNTRLRIVRAGKPEAGWIDQSGRGLVFAERYQPLALVALPEARPAALLEGVDLPVTGPVVLQAPASGVIRGRVLSPDGSPLFGARVQARRRSSELLREEEWSAWTNNRGRFVLEGPTTAIYEVTARHDAFSNSTARLEVKPQHEPLTLRLRPLVRFRGRVTDSGGVSVPRAQIETQEGGRGWVGSGDDGRFEVAFESGVSHAKLLVQHSDFAPVAVSVIPDSPGEAEVRLSRGARVALEITHPESVRVYATFESKEGRRLDPQPLGTWEETAMETSAKWSRAPVGRVHIRLMRDVGDARVLTYEAAEGESVHLEVALD